MEQRGPSLLHFKSGGITAMLPDKRSGGAVLLGGEQCTKNAQRWWVKGERSGDIVMGSWGGERCPVCDHSRPFSLCSQPAIVQEKIHKEHNFEH